MATKTAILLKKELKGRTPEQQKVIKYFMADDGCLSKKISDEEYQQLVQSRYASVNFKQKALDKIGLDESQVNEIPPQEFKGWLKEGNVMRKRGKDNIVRSSAFQVSWVFFSDDQLYVYQYTFNMNDDGNKETTEEYFYKDVTNFSTSSSNKEEESWEAGKGCLSKVPTLVRGNVNIEAFSIIVPGDRFICAMTDISEAEDKIKAMKNKLREKKG